MISDMPEMDEREPYNTDWLDDFWAAKPAYSEEFASEVTSRWDQHFQWCSQTGLISRWAKSYRTYHGLSQSGANATLGIRFAGEQGELADLEANQYRTLIQHVLNLGTSGRPSFDARATNNDSKSAKQVKLARDAIEYYLREKGTERRLKLVAETNLVFGAAFLHQFWDQHQGPPSQDGQRAGDIVHHVLTPLDVAHERVRDLESAHWWIVRDWGNRYDLAATYPELAEDIVGVSGHDGFDTLISHRIGAVAQDSEDEVPVFFFYHARTPAVPEGRHAILVGDIVVYDGPLPYEDCPVYAMQSSTFIGSGVGYASAWDVLGLHELYSGALSALTTRAAAFSVPTLVVDDGTPATVVDVSGMKLVRVPPGSREPSLLDLFSVPPALFQTMDLASSLMHAALGINSVISGGGQSDVKSGSHAALLQAMAIQFNSGFQASWAFLLEAFATGLVRLLKRFVREQRLLALAGAQGRFSVEAFTGEDLEGIDRVTIDLGNPMSRTAAGRYDIAKDLLGAGMVQTPEQFTNAISTGRLDPILDGPNSQIELTKAENERLAAGEQVPVIVFERHDLHVQEHLTLLNSPEAKADQRLANAVLSHVQQHFQQWLDLSMSAPHVLAAIKCPPLPVPQPAPAPPPPGAEMAGGPPGGPPPAPGPGGPPGAPVDTPMGPAGDVPNLPRMPTNPVNGQPAPGPAPIA